MQITANKVSCRKQIARQHSLDRNNIVSTGEGVIDSVQKFPFF